MPYPNLKIVKKIGDDFGVDWNVVSPKTFQKGIRVELEHGFIRGAVPSKTNLTNDNLYATAMIALAHLSEFPDYYDRLEKLEVEAKRFWKGKIKPSIFYL